MKIDELREYAKNNGFNSLRFRFTNLKGEIKECQWLDAYLGLFSIENNEGFTTTSQWKEATNDMFEFTII